jgi:hypothetical protein
MQVTWNRLLSKLSVKYNSIVSTFHILSSLSMSTLSNCAENGHMRCTTDLCPLNTLTTFGLRMHKEAFDLNRHRGQVFGRIPWLALVMFTVQSEEMTKADPISYHKFKSKMKHEHRNRHLQLETDVPPLPPSTQTEPNQKCTNPIRQVYIRLIITFRPCLKA